MLKSERVGILKTVSDGIAKVFGSETEVVLHDLEKGEAVYIVNGHVTGRNVGYKMNKSVCQAIIEEADSDGHLVGYKSQSASGKKLRASHMIFRDENGEPQILMCINQDTSQIEDIIRYLESMIKLRSISVEEGSEEHEAGENYIQKMTQKAILDSVEKMKPTDIHSREGRLELLKRLRKQGVFDVKDAVPYVCNVLSISQATLYNYLRELKNEDSSDPLKELKY